MIYTFSQIIFYHLQKDFCKTGSLYHDSYGKVHIKLYLKHVVVYHELFLAKN